MRRDHVVADGMNRLQHCTEELRRLTEIDVGNRAPFYTGGGRVPIADPRDVAKEWMREKARTRPAGTRVGGESRPEWEEYGRRMMLSPEDIAIGWSVIAARPPGIAGVQPRGLIPGQYPEKPVRNPGRVAMGVQTPDSPFESRMPDARTAHVALLRHRLEGTTTPLSGYYVGMPWMAQGANMPMSDAPGFPFATDAAERVWKIAQNLIALYPEANASQVLVYAIEKANIGLYELTPEDGRLLELAISWAQNGPVKGTGNRIGGAPGGPFNSTGGRAMPGGGL